MEVVGDRLLVAGFLIPLNFSLCLIPKSSTHEDHREPQRNRIFFFRRLLLFFSTPPSVLSVAFLGVLCVKFRRAQPKMCAPCEHFGGQSYRVRHASCPQPRGRGEVSFKPIVTQKDFA
jgi:hypothetical protein